MTINTKNEDKRKNTQVHIEEIKRKNIYKIYLLQLESDSAPLSVSQGPSYN